MIKENKIDFSVFLASMAHDMKNSLGMLLNEVDEALIDCVDENCPSHKHLSLMQYEATRVNYNLIQLLTLYKMEQDHFSTNVSLYSVADFLEENILQNKPLLDFKEIEIVVECPDELNWFFDRDLIAGIVNNVLNNAFRYTRNRIKIRAAEKDGYWVLNIEDDGDGYPDEMLKADIQTCKSTSFKTGSTGLGLYFASTVASMHKNKGREGFISITNDSEYGGSCFTLTLP